MIHSITKRRLFNGCFRARIQIVYLIKRNKFRINVSEQILFENSISESISSIVCRLCWSRDIRYDPPERIFKMIRQIVQSWKEYRCVASVPW